MTFTRTRDAARPGPACRPKPRFLSFELNVRSAVSPSQRGVSCSPLDAIPKSNCGYCSGNALSRIHLACRGDARPTGLFPDAFPEQ